MTQVIDGKVVEMKFDNADFERNVAQSMSTLDKLKQALNFDSAKGLENVTKASKSFDMSGVGSAVETVQAKFSALQVIGVTALAELTKAAMNFGANVVRKVVDPIASGGMNRAMNIEQAKFQLAGLGVAWSDIEDDINYGVKDTAYGLDSAAKAASQLTASGVELGDEMKSALRGISGVAAMTNASFDEISPIFTTVAGQGKLMTMQLRQLESRGLNAAATLGKYLGKTEAEVRELVTDGKIDFQTFANAMDDAFGAHAKDANKTFTGAMSNVRAALSRIGANFATPYMENMRKIAVEAIQVINGINKAMQPIYDITSAIMEKIQGKITDFLGNVALKDAYTRIINGITTSFYALLGILEPIKRAFKDIFPKDFIWTLRDAAKSFEAFTEKLIISDSTAEKIRRTFKGVFAVFDILGTAIKALFDTIRPFTGGLGDVLGSILDFSAGMGDYLVNLRDSIKANDTFGKAFRKAADIVSNAGTKIKDILTGIVDAIKNFKANHIDDKDFSGFTNFFERIKERLPSFEELGNIFGKVFDKIKSVFSNFGPAFKAGVQLISDSIGILLKGFADAFSGSGNDPFTAFLNIFSTTTIGTMFVSFAQALAQVKKQVQNMGGLSGILFEVRNALKTFQADLKADVLMKLAKAIAVLAGSIFVLSLINPARLTSSMVAIGIMTKILEEFISFMSNIPLGSWKAQAQFFGISNMMMSLGLAILVLAGAVKVLSTIDFLDLVKGIGAVVILIKVMADQAVLLSNIDTKVMKGAKTMIALAIAVRILASAVKVMAEIPFTSLVKGMIATVGLIYALVGAVKLMNGAKLSVGTGIALIGMAAALLILTNAVEKLGAIPYEQLRQGLIAAVIGIAALAGALTLIGNFAKGGTLVAAAVALLAMSAALSVFAGVVERFAAIPLDNLVQGILAAVIGIVAMTAALMALTALNKGGQILAAAASILIMAVGLDILSKAIERLGKMKIGDLIKAFVTLVVVIGGFALAASALAPVLPLMAALAGVVVLLGVGVVALGLGVAALSIGLATLATSCTAVVANLGAILTIIAAIIPAIATALANGLIQFVVVIGNGAAQIIQAVVNIGKAIIQALIVLIPDLVQLVIVAGQGIIDAIVWLIPALVEAGMKLIIGLRDGIARQIPDLVRSGMEMMLTLINTMADAIRVYTPQLIVATDNLMNAILEAIQLWFSHFVEKGGDIVHKLIEGIKKIWEEIKGVGKELVDKAGKGIEEGIKNIVQLGKDLVAGFIEGITSAPGKIWDAAKGVAQTAIDAIAKTQDSNSPAKEGIKKGKDLSDGYAIGISDGREDIQNSAEYATEGAISTFEAAQERIAAIRADMANNQSWYTKMKSEYQKSTQTDTKVNKELREEHFKVKKAEDDVIESTENLTEAQTDLATATGKSSGAAKEQKDIFDKIKDSITSSIDIFSKFELKTELTGAQLLENMKSNIDGVASWTSKLNSLIDKGISKELYDKLAEMGPKSYETVNAMTQMTAEQLSQANDYFAQSLTIGDSQTAIIKDSYDRVGVGVAQGAINGLNSKSGEMHATGVTAGADLTDAVAEGAGTHSPSTKTYLTGINVLLGLINGISNATTLAMLYLKIDYVCTRIIAHFNDGLRSDKFYEIGKNATAGLANGLADSDTVKALYARADEIATQVSEKMKKALKEESPSRVTRQIGAYATEGLAIGLMDAANNAYNAAKKVADGTVEGLSTTGRIQDVLDTELDLNPVITPMLDLSIMRAQLASISDMMSNPAYGVGGQNGGQFTANGTQPASINFTQNNYSPKELSRYDIYRNTKNQISMMKGVIAHA